ncbi:MAG: TIGR01777 family oxidoreductase [Chitinophagaceae bacterium]|nr:TIGR01777 family oxidoreductase [Chitinophagaceae bacterium]
MSLILITGGTGLIGKELTRKLVAKGHEVIILTREIKEKNFGEARVSYAAWDVKAQTIDKEAIAKADHIIHLAGAGIADERWTEKRKEEIKSSRIDSSKLIVTALSQNANKVKTVVSASAIGWYGADERLGGKKAFTEDTPADTGFLGETCKLWEESIKPVEALGKRLVILRTGIVLSNDGGAFKSFKLPVKFGLAAILGNGKQVISWIHIDDICDLYLYAIENATLSGELNAVAPHPVSNKTLTIELAKTLKGKFFIPIHVPAFLLKLLLGEMSVEVLKSTTVSSQKTEEAGFHFKYPGLPGALNNLCK